MIKNYLLKRTFHVKIDVFLEQLIENVDEDIQHGQFIKSTHIKRLIDEGSIVTHMNSLDVDPWIFKLGCHIKL